MTKCKNEKTGNESKQLALSKEGEKNNLSSPGIAKLLSKRILEDIDEYCIKTYDGGHRSHLGASLIGEECKRKLWYIFRWCKHEKTTGRRQRLFNRGHREEDRFIEWLEGIGVKVWADDLQNNTLWYDEKIDDYFLTESNNTSFDNLNLVSNVTNDKIHIARAKADGLQFPQYRISAVNGHFGGSLDGICKLPERFGIDEPLLLEFKTNGTGRPFNDLCANGMTVSKPQHFAQTSTYGYKYGLNYVLYLNICKNDDAIHCEIVKLNHNLGQQMELKAAQIITSQRPPAKLSQSETYFKCKWCHFNEICHKGAIVERNCRSCKYAKPAENATWFCANCNAIIPKEYIPNACESYKSITDKV